MRGPVPALALGVATTTMTGAADPASPTPATAGRGGLVDTPELDTIRRK